MAGIVTKRIVLAIMVLLTGRKTCSKVDYSTDAVLYGTIPYLAT
jgi:hypothetical protein